MGTCELREQPVCRGGTERAHTRSVQRGAIRGSDSARSSRHDTRKISHRDETNNLVRMRTSGRTGWRWTDCSEGGKGNLLRGAAHALLVLTSRSVLPEVDHAVVRLEK